MIFILHLHGKASTHKELSQVLIERLCRVWLYTAFLLTSYAVGVGIPSAVRIFAITAGPLTSMGFMNDALKIELFEHKETLLSVKNIIFKSFKFN